MDTKKNSFKQLGQEDVNEVGKAPDQVEHNVMGLVHSGHLFGDVIELYFSKMIDLVLSLFGADHDKQKKQ